MFKTAAPVEDIPEQVEGFQTTGTTCADFFATGGIASSDSLFQAWKTSNMATTAQMNTLADCIDAEITRINPLPTAITTLRSDKAQKVEELKIARDRVKYTRNPGRPVSYYESWFPSGRPLEKTSIIALLSISIFLVLVTVLLFAASMGYVFTFMIPAGPPNPFLVWLKGFGAPFWLLLVAFIGVLVYFLRYYKT